MAIKLPRHHDTGRQKRASPKHIICVGGPEHGKAAKIQGGMSELAIQDVERDANNNPIVKGNGLLTPTGRILGSYKTTPPKGAQSRQVFYWHDADPDADPEVYEYHPDTKPVIATPGNA